MGRVASYKKVKTSYKNHSGGEYVWGTNAKSKAKKRSLTAQKHQAAKRRGRRNKDQFDDGGFDLPPEKDDFDLKDMFVKKVKKKRLDHDLAFPSVNELKTVTPSIPTSASSSVSTSTSTNVDDVPKDDDGNTNSGVRPSAIVKNNSVKIGNTNLTCHIPADDRAEIRAAKLLKMDPKTGKSISKQSINQTTIEGRREGESMNAFNRRLKEETVKALADNYKKSRGGETTTGSGTNVGEDGKMTKSQRRKEYSKMRKRKKKGKGNYVVDPEGVGSGGASGLSKYDNDDGFVTGENAVSFLEQAERPPIFNQLPRGAHKKLKLKMKGVKDDDDDCDGDGDGRKKRKKTMNEGTIKKEQDAMEVMRRKVQAQYAIMKAKRRQKEQGPSFHL